MPSYKLNNVAILYQPHHGTNTSGFAPGTLIVTSIDNLGLRQKFALDWTRPCLTYSSDPNVQFGSLMLLFRMLTVEFGVPANDVDAAFMKIEEYADALLGDG